MVETRSSTEIHLIGQLTEKLSHDVLPTTLDVLKKYFFLHSIRGFSQKDSLKIVGCEIVEIWSQLDIPICAEKNVVRKLYFVMSRYRDLGRSKKRGGPTQLDHEKKFVASISKLFDISKKNSLNIMRNENYKIFLEDQRTNRKYSIALIQKINEKEEQEKLDHFRRAKQKYGKSSNEEKELEVDTPIDSLTTALSQLSSSDGSGLSQNILDGDEDACSQEIVYEKRQKRIKITNNIQICSESVAMALDRANISNAKAVHVLAAVATTSTTTDLKNVPLSVSTVRRVRNSYRSKLAVPEKTVSFAGPLVLHFDGKLLPSLAGPTKEDRIAIVVSGDKVEKLLGVPKIESGKGKLIAEASFSVVSEWGLENQIVGMSFDTTAANTGLKNGACVLLEQKIKKDLIWLPCRHHILEVVLKHVFNALFGATDGPNVCLFKRFKEFWPNIDVQKYSPCSDKRLDDTLLGLKNDAVQFLLSTLNEAREKLPRDDYRELAELALIFLGEKPPRDVKFRAPGAFHHARWMAKVIYVLKMYIFRHEFELTLSQQISCLEFGLFSVLIYVKAWITCPNVVDAPYNDLQLIQKIISYKSTSETISTAALNAFKRHFWYLGQELAVVSLFSDLVDFETKNTIVRLLTRNRIEQSSSRSVKYTGTTDLSTKTLDYFIGPASYFIFNVLGLCTSFFNEDAQQWNNLESYNTAKQLIKALNPVNDCAERGVALASEFNNSRTKNEEQYQCLLQVVERHRKRFPDAKKTSIMQNMF